MRTALITGASRGIGQVCARVLGASGYRVVAAARNLEKLEETAELDTRHRRRGARGLDGHGGGRLDQQRDWDGVERIRRD